MLAIAAVVLLVKVNSTANHSPPETSSGKCSKGEAMDIEMTPNELYGTGDNITTKPNVVYGGIFPSEPTNQSGIYKHM